MKFVRLGIVGLAMLVGACGQTPADANPVAGTTPPSLPPIRPRSWNTIRKGEAFVPMTGSDRIHFLWRRTIASPGVPARAMFQAAFDQKANWPEKWGQGWDAYGQRVLFHMGRSGARNLIESGAAAALGYDQRYVRCNCEGVLRRTGHALAMSFVTYDRNGHWAPNVPRIGSTVAVEYLVLPMLPDGTRTSREVTRGLGLHVASGSIVNIWREFSPDLRRRLKLGR